MSGGGSQTTAATPWGPASPYLLDIMQKAQQQYGTTAGQYANPAGNFGYGQATGAVGSAIGGTTPYGSLAANLTPDTQAAIKAQLSGTPDYSAVQQALDAANQQTWDSFNNQELPQLNQRASFLGNPSGAIKDLNWATANIGKNMDLNAQQQYLQQYNLAKQQQANAMGLGANIAQGAAGQQLEGANLYQSLAQMPQTNLADYAALVSGTGGKFGTDTTSMKPGAGQTAANVIGGLTAGAGLVNSLFGGSGSGGAVGAIGSMFGGGSGAAAAGDAAAVGDAASGLGAAGGGLGAGAAGAGAAGAGAGASDLGALGTTTYFGDAAGTAAGAGSAGTAAAGGEAAAGGAASGGAGSAAAGTLGPVAGGAAAVALPLAAALYGNRRNPVDLHQSYWANIEKTLQSGKDDPQYWNTVTQLLGMASQDHVDAPEAQAILDKYGISFYQNPNVTQGAAVQRVGARSNYRA